MKLYTPKIEVLSYLQYFWKQLLYMKLLEKTIITVTIFNNNCLVVLQH